MLLPMGNCICSGNVIPYEPPFRLDVLLTSVLRLAMIDQRLREVLRQTQRKPSNSLTSEVTKIILFGLSANLLK